MCLGFLYKDMENFDIEKYFVELPVGSPVSSITIPGKRKSIYYYRLGLSSELTENSTPRL